MNKKIIALLLIVALGVAYYFFQRDSPEIQIKNRFDDFIVAVHKPQKMKGITQIGKINSLKHFFSEDIQISSSKHRVKIESRDKLMKLAQIGFRMEPRFKLSFEDLIIEVNSSSSATVYLTAVANGTRREGTHAQELKLKLKKESGDWVIAEAEAVHALTLDQ